MQADLSIRILHFLDKLPPKTQEQVLAFIEFLLNRQEGTTPTPTPEKNDFKQPENNSSLPDTDILRMRTLPNGKQIAVTPADENVPVEELFGIWKDQSVNMEKLRNQAWGGRQ